MTDKELKKLSRMELLEMLLLQTQEVERLQAEMERMHAEHEQIQAELKQLQEQLQHRELEFSQAGSIAEAALQLSGIFESAQKAADLYLGNLHKLESKTLERCKRIEAQCQEWCRKYVHQAELDSKQFWLQIQDDIYDPYVEHERWIKIHSALTGKVYKKLNFKMCNDEKKERHSDARILSTGAGD